MEGETQVRIGSRALEILTALVERPGELVSIGNPDLVARLRRNAPLTEADKATYYGGGAEGYTDYRTLDEAVGA